MHLLEQRRRAGCGGGLQLRQRRQPLPQHATVAQRVVQPMPQQTAAHVAGAGVQQGKQRRRRLAAQGLADFQIAPRGRIHAHIAVGVIHLQAVEVAEVLPLRQLDIAQQRARCRHRHVHLRAAKTGQIQRGKLLAQGPPRRVGIEMPIRQTLAYRRRVQRQATAFRLQHLRRLQPLQLRRQLRGAGFTQPELPSGQTQPSQAQLALRHMHRQQPIVALLLQ